MLPMILNGPNASTTRGGSWVRAGGGQATNDATAAKSISRKEMRDPGRLLTMSDMALPSFTIPLWVLPAGHSTEYLARFRWRRTARIQGNASGVACAETRMKGDSHG